MQPQSPGYDSDAAAGTDSRTTLIRAKRINGIPAEAQYQTLPGNQPNTYGNLIVSWQGGVMPCNDKPFSIQPVDSNTEAGSVLVTASPQTTVVAYSVGPELRQAGVQPFGNVCAYDIIPPLGEGPSIPFSSEINIVSISANSIVANYSVPACITPMNNGAWIGLWRSSVAPYQAPPPIVSNLIPINSSTGSVGLNNVQLQRGMTYTVALFMSGWRDDGVPAEQTAMACSSTFTT